MAKEIICPHCKKNLLPTEGFDHDDNLNLLCTHCKGVLFAASKETENKVKSSLQKVEIQHWQKKDCLPIRMQPSSNIITPAVTSHHGYEVYGD